MGPSRRAMRRIRRRSTIASPTSANGCTKSREERMSDEALRDGIEAAWEVRDSLGADTKGELRDVVDTAIERLDSGSARVAEKGPDGWTVNQWLKKAVLLSFRLNPMEAISGGPGGASWWDKGPSKFAGWGAKSFTDAGFRAVPGAIVRRGAFIGKGAVLMPSFVNIGARVDEGAMIDTWATVGSCAQTGRNVHISGGAGIGGVLEPLQAGPVIIEDDCFIGARSEVAEGAIVEQGAVLPTGCVLRAVRGPVHGRVPGSFDQDRGSRVGRSLLRPRPRLFGGGPGRSSRQG